MKKLMSLSVVLFVILAFGSCEKAAKLLFKPFESPLNFEIEIPVVSSTTEETALGATTISYNLEEEIRKNTEQQFGADIVGAMYISNVAITLLESGPGNDLRNFDYLQLNVSSGAASATNFGPFQLPGSAVTTATFPVSGSANVKPFFSGANVHFTMRGKANKATSRTLRARISATLRFEK
jgi:hypothetical protein